MISLVDLAEAARSGDRRGILPTAADAFSEAHDRGRVDEESGWYRARMPVSMPGTGQQFAFSVELDACTGCKACVVACHSLNGLDEDELWRRVGVLHGVPTTSSGFGVAEQRTVTTACHHCVDPGCLNGCPVDAYEKDPLTGAVVHLDDQCIGCSYCTMTCPYEVPKFNDRLGIVRKCDMCRGRLVAGEEPACVQGCPNGAIRIVTVDQQLVLKQARYVGSPSESLVPGAARSALSVPTTIYRSGLESLEGLVNERVGHLQPSTAHDPLAAMLVLTQAGVGASVVDACLRLIGLSPGRHLAVVAPLIAAVGMALSFAHLGRPSKAWRVVLGFGHSWLSREAVALGAFLAAASLNAIAPKGHFAAGAAVLGGIGVFTSIKVYAVTGRDWWSLRRTTQRFTLGSLMFGLALASLLAATDLSRRSFSAASCIAVALVLWTTRAPSNAVADQSIRVTSELLHGPLRVLQRSSQISGLAASLAFFIAAMFLSTIVSQVLAIVGVVFLIASALIERSLFFRAVGPSRMPGW